MKDDTIEVWQKVRLAIENKDKLAFSEYMVALQIKGKRDIVES